MNKNLITLFIFSTFLLSACQQSTTRSTESKNTIADFLVNYELIQDLPGKDADTIIIFKNSGNLKTYFSLNEITKLGLKIDQVLVVANFKKQALIGRIQFTDSEVAEKSKPQIDSYFHDSLKLSDQEKYASTVKDQILEFKISKGDSELEGKLTDNPRFQTLQKSDYLDQNLIAYFDNSENPEIMLSTQLMVGLLSNTYSQIKPLPASSQTTDSPSDTGFITASDAPSSISSTIAPESKEKIALNNLSSLIGFSQETIMMAKLLPDDLAINFQVQLTNPEKLKDTKFFKYLQEVSNNDESLTVSDIEKNYSESLEKMHSSITDLNIAPTPANQNVTVTTSLNESNLLKVIIYIPRSSIEKSLLEGPIKARDVSRKAALNKIITGIEIYNSENSSYPEKSSCLNKMPMLNVYFKDNIIPSDIKGTQFFGPIECTSGYYYLHCPDGYSIWSKMELTENGNTNLAPSTEADYQITKSDSGQYYVVNQGCPEGADISTTTTIPKKIRRIK